jgi:hypothetical protein
VYVVDGNADTIAPASPATSASEGLRRISPNIKEVKRV